MVDSNTLFEVTAYDKDGGYYDTIHSTPSLLMAIRIAKSLAGLVKMDSLRNPKTHEPYDWIEIFHGDKSIKVVTE